MKIFRAFTCSLTMLICSAMAYAAPLQYQFNGTHLTGPLVGSLFAEGTNLSGSFLYDPTTPLTSANNPASSPYHGPMSYYYGAATNFSGSVLEKTFYSETGDTHVADASDDTLSDGVATVVGYLAQPDSTAHNSLNGFTIGDFSLIGVSFSFSGDSNLFSSQSLPTTLSNDHAIAILLFKDTAGNMSPVVFEGSLTPVPLPSSALFFLSGLAGLGLNAVRKLKR